ncbi:MAG: hypothetical protein PHN49_01915 [Candidatus Omnitrophica bacterium]|nr:hypothetical protein [Candidatus Omnitrophota bacterium]MDD5670375.1 hypothetical protein [Candidatus Omnitrophota bacterium]
MGHKRGIFILFFIFLASFGAFKIGADTFIGVTKTGLIKVENFRYPVFLFVPDNLKPGRKYPMVISVPDVAETAEKNIDRWISVAKRSTVLVLVPTYLEPRDTPNALDRWFFEVKNLMVSAYPVNPKKVFLVGQKSGATYAAYLGVNYPEEFSAMALLNGSWVGQQGSWTGVFEKLMRLESTPEKQIPIYVGLNEDQKDIIEKTEKTAYDFQKRGYFVEVRKFPAGEDLITRDYQKTLIQWLDERSEDWATIVQNSQKNWQEKFKKWARDFFAV